MLNILSYVGMNLQSEVCLWTLLGLLRTIFDATLFKVNANLKQVWQMKMPVELSLPVQRALRTMISGVMLVQCFTVYVYLASYIVLLYPVFLEERPTLVLPWLLLAAIRNFLCELTSLALGLGTCVLLGPARPSCIRFVILKLASIMPAFYMWMLILGYYHNLKMASAFKTFPTVLPAKDLDYGVELAVRRRRTKSLQGEEQLRKKLIATLYGEQNFLPNNVHRSKLSNIYESNKNSPIGSEEDIKSRSDTQCPLSVIPNRTMSDIGTYEDWFGSEVVLPRDTDRILEQIVLMLLRIGAFLKIKDSDRVKLLNSTSLTFLPQRNKVICPRIPTEETDTPPLVGSSKGRIASYLRDYPQIFMKKPSEVLGPIKSPENNQPIISSSSTQSTDVECTDKAPLNNGSLIVKNKLLNKKSSDTFIHSHENLNESGYFHNKRIENIDTSPINTKDDDSNKLKAYSKTSMESVINRMKIRAATKEISNDDNNVEPNTPTTSQIANKDNKSLSKQKKRKSLGSSNDSHNNSHLNNTNKSEPKNGKNNHFHQKM